MVRWRVRFPLALHFLMYNVHLVLAPLPGVIRVAMVRGRQCNSGSITSCEPYDWAVNGAGRMGSNG